MDYKFWEENTWTKQTSEILKGLSKFPSHLKITVILRHSQRYEPKLVDEKDFSDYKPPLLIFFRISEHALIRAPIFIKIIKKDYFYIKL